MITKGEAETLHPTEVADVLATALHIDRPIEYGSRGDWVFALVQAMRGGVHVRAFRFRIKHDVGLGPGVERGPWGNAVWTAEFLPVDEDEPRGWASADWFEAVVRAAAVSIANEARRAELAAAQ